MPGALRSILDALTSPFLSAEGRDERALARADRVDIAAAADGTTVKIVGELRLAGEGLVAPVSHRPCAHHELIVESRNLDPRDPSPRHEGSWSPIAHAIESQDFLLEDATGTALVRVEGAHVLVTWDAKGKLAVREDVGPEIAALLEQHGRSAEHLLQSGHIKLRWAEGVLEPGERVAVMGRCRRKGDEVVIEPLDDGLLVSDDPDLAR